MTKNNGRCSKVAWLLALMIAVAGYGCGVSYAASGYTRVGRYLTVANKPTAAQADLLKQVVQVRFPEDVQTVGEAVQHILRFSGYELVAEKELSVAANKMLQLKLPIVDRELGPVSLKAALQTLAGEPFRLVVNKVSRQISFKLRRQR